MKKLSSKLFILGAQQSATGEEFLEYRALVAYASSLTDTLLFIHYLTVILIEIRHLQPVYYIKVFLCRLDLCIYCSLIRTKFKPTLTVLGSSKPRR